MKNTLTTMTNCCFIHILQINSLITSPITGLDAVINDLKSGRVTLRRRQPRVSVTPKEDFTKIYDLLEKNKTQNRSSIKIMNNELTKAFQKFNINV